MAMSAGAIQWIALAGMALILVVLVWAFLRVDKAARYREELDRPISRRAMNRIIQQEAQRTGSDQGGRRNPMSHEQ